MAGVARFLSSGPGRALQQIWINWRARRDSLRARFCLEVEPGLDALYREGRSVELVLGGPPCKGWSRIGRAVGESLRLQGVHAWACQHYGDERNSFSTSTCWSWMPCAPRRSSSRTWPISSRACAPRAVRCTPPPCWRMPSPHWTYRSALRRPISNRTRSPPRCTSGPRTLHPGGDSGRPLSNGIASRFFDDVR